MSCGIVSSKVVFRHVPHRNVMISCHGSDMETLISESTKACGLLKTSFCAKGYHRIDTVEADRSRISNTLQQGVPPGIPQPCAEPSTSRLRRYNEEAHEPKLTAMLDHRPPPRSSLHHPKISRPPQWLRTLLDRSYKTAPHHYDQAPILLFLPNPRV